jgi:hypothetical protein
MPAVTADGRLGPHPRPDRRSASVIYGSAGEIATELALDEQEHLALPAQIDLERLR